MELEAARALVPWWVFPVAVLTHAVAAFVVAVLLGAVLFDLGRRAIARPAPWPLRARALYPPRVAMVLAAYLVPFAAGVCLATGRHGFLGGDAVVVAAVVAASSLPLAFWQWRLTRQIVVAGHSLRDALTGFVTRALVLHASTWAALLVALSMPSRPGPAGAALLAGGAALLVVIARGGAFAVARALNLAPPVPPGIADAVRAAAEQAGVPLAGVHQVTLPEANVFAMPFAFRIVFSRAALWKIDLKGLLAIAGHEIAHLAEPPRARRMRMAGLLCLLPVMCAKPVLAAAGLPAAGLVVLLPLLVRRVLRRRLRRMETDADASAAEPGTYARALEELYRLNLVPVVRGAATHPDLADRLKALGASPAYPPSPAPSFAARLVLGVLVGAAASVPGLWWEIAARHAEAAGRPYLAVALDGGGPWTLAELARTRDDPAEAAIFCAAGRVLEPDSPYWPAYESMSLAADGRFEEARRALEEAELRARASDDPPLDLLAEARERVERAR